jgi:glutamate racemase
VGQGFVELVEKGCTSGPEAEGVVTESLKPLLDEGADRIVLGCTHYPFLSETISKTAAIIAPERDIKIIDPAPAVAKHLLEIMKENRLIKKDGFNIVLKSSGDDTILQETYGRLV